MSIFKKPMKKIFKINPIKFSKIPKISFKFDKIPTGRSQHLWLKFRDSRKSFQISKKVYQVNAFNTVNTVNIVNFTKFGNDSNIKYNYSKVCNYSTFENIEKDKKKDDPIEPGKKVIEKYQTVNQEKDLNLKYNCRRVGNLEKDKKDKAIEPEKDLNLKYNYSRVGNIERIKKTKPLNQKRML